MIKANYHTHSCYCDGKESLRRYVETAVERGFTHLGFSGHAPVPFENTFAIDGERYLDYCNEVRGLKEEFADRLKIFLGLEIDYIPGVLDNFEELITTGGLDYCIGSVHLVNKMRGGDLWFIDGSKQQSYDEGLSRVFDGNIKEAVRAFFRQTNEMIASQRPSIVGHFDKVAMHNKERYFGTDEEWYLALVRETLELIKECGCVCEINTRGIYKGRYSDFYPATRIIRIMNTMDIPAVVSTDAHQPDDLDKFEGVYTLLREVGYKRLVYFDDIWREMKVL